MAQPLTFMTMFAVIAKKGRDCIISTNHRCVVNIASEWVSAVLLLKIRKNPIVFITTW